MLGLALVGGIKHEEDASPVKFRAWKKIQQLVSGA
jgi:hypothetical protein